MPDLIHKKNLSAPFLNAQCVQTARYSFSEDGGATGDYVAFTAKEDCLIDAVEFHVITALTSGGSATLAAGIAANQDLFIDSIAVASMTANAFHTSVLTEGTPNTTVVPARLAKDATIVFSIEVAALTAGALDVVVKYRKF